MTVEAVDITAKVAFLRRPEVYPDRPSRVVVIETHMSWVFLTDLHVYKLRKPVRTDYLDFSTLARRLADCEEELRLNRRLAPDDVYLGIVALTREGDGTLALAGRGEVVEWLVKMRRLPHDRMLDACIAQGSVTPAEVDRFTGALVAFYRQTAPEPMSGEAYRQRWRRDVLTNHRVLLAADRGLPVAQLERLRDGLLGFVDTRAALLAARAGRVIEAHGDLRPEHVCLTEPPVFIDRLEFNRALRLLDPLEELAFLALECEHAGAAWIGERVFATYQALSGERPAAELLLFYKAGRAQLRARLSASHLTDHPPRVSAQKWLRKTRDYLALAQRYLAAVGG